MHIIRHYLPFLRALMLHRRNIHVYILQLNTSALTENVKHLQYIDCNVLLCVLLHSTVSRYEYFRAVAHKTVTQNRNEVKFPLRFPLRGKNEYFHILDWCNEKCCKIDIVLMTSFLITFSTTTLLMGKKVKEETINDYYNDNENLKHFIQFWNKKNMICPRPSFQGLVTHIYANPDNMMGSCVCPLTRPWVF